MSDQAIAVIPDNAVQTQPAAPSPIEMAQSFLQAGGDLASLEKMMDLQERHEKNEAKKAFVQAMAAFKANPPKINKDKKVAFKQTRYSHASLGNVTAKINQALGEHGLSASWKPSQEGNMITVTCTITHELGHSESTSLTAGADTSGAKNSIQALGSTISYLERYTILALTGLATHDQDDDGQSAPVKTISEKQISTITDMMNEYITDPDDFLKWAGVESVEQIPASDYGRIMSALKAVQK